MSSQLFNISIHDLARHKTAAAALLPVLLPTAYVVYLNWTVRRSTTCISGTHSKYKAATEAAPEPRIPNSLPEEVVAHPSEWVVCYERVVSQPVATAALIDALNHDKGGNARKSGTSGSDSDSTASPLFTRPSPLFTRPSPLFTSYLRSTYKAFSWTPQAFLIRAMLAEEDRRASFGAGYIESLAFADGDIVDGVYRVTSYEHGSECQRGLEAIELSIDVPASYKGPPVRGLIMSAIQPVVTADDDGAASAPPERILFVNETWLWRRKEEKATLLESAFGKWFHSLLAGWLVKKGLAGLARGA